MGSTKISSPSTPPAPSGADAVNAWAAQLPSIYATQLQYEPQLLQQQLAMQNAYATPILNQQMALEAQYQPQIMERQMQLQQQYQPQMLRQEYDLQKEYMPKMAQAQYDITNQLYPETAGLQEQLATKASQGMNSQVPTWMQDQYRSNMNAQLGTNAGSPIGADYMSRGLLQQQQDWQNYYNNLGLSVTGRQPLTQPNAINTPQVNTPQINTPQYQGTNWTQSWNPTNTWQNMNQGYGSYSSAYANMYGSNQQAAASRNQMIGSIVGGLGSAAGAMSSKRFKRNIKLWA